MKSTAPDGSSKVLRWYVGAFLFVWISLGSYHLVNPTAREGRAILDNLSTQQILYISIEPARDSSFVPSPVVVRDRQTIASLASALSHMPSHLPEHPQIIRAAVLRIQLRDRVVGGEIDETKNDGVDFRYNSSVTEGWVYGDYQVPADRRIFAIIERAIRPQKPKADSRLRGWMNFAGPTK